MEVYSDHLVQPGHPVLELTMFLDPVQVRATGVEEEGYRHWEGGAMQGGGGEEAGKGGGGAGT